MRSINPSVRQQAFIMLFALTPIVQFYSYHVKATIS